MKRNYNLSPVNLFFSIVVLLLIFGCKNTNVEDKTTFFGGKIKNPLGKYVYLIEGKKVLDSAKLDAQYKFSFQIESLKLGLYSFKHGPEFQYLYLEPNDSLLLYLNTWDFDESLIFSGKGAAKNNYLINLYLQQEKFEKNFKSNYRLKEKEFTDILDQELKKHLNQYNKLIQNEGEEPSVFFDKLAKTGIYYPMYYLKEHYAYNHKHYSGSKEFPKISDDFYNYREDVDLNDESLIHYGPYMAFVSTYLYHLAYNVSYDDPKKDNIQLNFMQVVNDKITIERYKNELLAAAMWRSLKNNESNNKELNDNKGYFLANCSDKKLISEIEIAIKQKEELKCGESLPKLLALNTRGVESSINDISKNNNTVIYFWPKDLGQGEILNEKLIKLKKMYPDIIFIGIERNKTDEDWKKFIHLKKLPQNTQFKLSKKSNNYSWFDGDMARAIIVDKNGMIKNNYVFFTDKYFEEYLKKLN